MHAPAHPRAPAANAALSVQARGVGGGEARRPARARVPHRPAEVRDGPIPCERGNRRCRAPFPAVRRSPDDIHRTRVGGDARHPAHYRSRTRAFAPVSYTHLTLPTSDLV